tara:strand:- start:901 stop:1128 length:228 start_codon:yes stop_codon:yes gene_type:complete
MPISYSQWYNGYTQDIIDKASYNVIKIKEKILMLNEKLETRNTNKTEIDEINDRIERLDMSKECIKYYYGLDIDL